MSDQSNDVVLSLENILLGIADSLTEAQATLKSIQPYDEYGRPNTIYELPYLDFKLQVTSEFHSETDQLPNNVARVSSDYWRFSRPTMLFKPVNNSETTTTQGDITSTISGRFVANAPNQGLPQVFLNTSTVKLEETGTWQQYKLSVLLSNSVGERLVNSTVELNFNDQDSLSINGVEVTRPELDIAQDETDDQGQLEFVISLPLQDYINGRTFVFVVNTGTIYKEFSISN